MRPGVEDVDVDADGFVSARGQSQPPRLRRGKVPWARPPMTGRLVVLYAW